MTYIQIAFKRYSIIQSPWKMPLANNHGWQYFIQAFRTPDFLRALRNTFMLNFLDLAMGFPAPIILALLLNELPFKGFKRVTQTVALPHFLSWIIISGLARQLFAPTSGLVNIVIQRLGGSHPSSTSRSIGWPPTCSWGVAVDGVNTIIYLAAITAINPELYEAADIDGAGRLQKIWYVTLPSIKGTIIVLLILALGNILGGGFDRPYTLGNPLVRNVSEVIPTFVYSWGIKGLQFSLTTAVGLFQSVVGVFFLLGADFLAKRAGERGIV